MRLVRQRMAEIRERYTEARAALATTSASPPPGTTRSLHAKEERWIELLGDPQQNQGAFRLLRQLTPEDLRPLAIAGTSRASAKLRRRSCQLLDDLPLTRDTVAALEVFAADPDPRVRAAALHSLSCEHRKPDGVCLDQRMIAQGAANDPSAKVRRGVVMGLSWRPERSDEWAVAMATRFLADPSSEIRRYARAAIARIERQRRTDEERRQLPEPLRRKTQRHPGKWVAIVDGRSATRVCGRE